MQSTLSQFAEVQSTGAFTLQNSKLLKVSLQEGAIRAAQGSMVAYQGEVSFEVASSGLGRLVKKAVTGEGPQLMSVSGSGEVFLAVQAQDIHLLTLENESITVNASNLLAFEDQIDWDIKRVSGGGAAVMGGGLFNTELKGSGMVAIISDGPPIMLDPASAPTFADAQAAITWSAGVTTSVKVDAKLSSLIRGGSGETLQVAFGGSGWVLIQPSEGLTTAQTTGGGGALGGGLGKLLSG